MQIKIKNTKLFLAAIFVLCTGSQLFSYGGNTAIAPLLTAIGGYEFYSLVAPLGATGMMVALPAVAALGRKNWQQDCPVPWCIFDAVWPRRYAVCKQCVYHRSV